VEESDDESASDLYTEEEDDDECDEDDVSEDSSGRLKDMDGMSLKQENVLPNKPALAVPLPVLEVRMRQLGIQAFGSKKACEAESANLMRKNSKPQRQRNLEEESSSSSLSRQNNTSRISGGNMDNREEAINSINSRTIYNSSNKGDNARVK
jgi:hypothetical protein